MEGDINLEENLEIKKALKEFEIKNVEQVQQAPLVPESSGNPKIIQFVIKYSGGLVKDERQAEYVLLVFSILIIIFSLILFFGSKNTNKVLFLE